MAIQFQKAERTQSRLRLALVGPAGSGKTLTALLIAKGLGGKVAVLDTEHGSAAKYAGDSDVPEFDHATLTNFAPQHFIDAINSAAAAGYNVVILDSLSHAWTGTGGALEQVDQATARSRSKNAFAEGWREVTPLHNRMIDAIVQAPIHVIATMRVKTEWVIEEDERGKKVPRKIGLAPIQRSGLEFEFDVVADMDSENKLIVSKSRCRTISNAVIKHPTAELGERLRQWLEEGAPAVEHAPPKMVTANGDGRRQKMLDRIREMEEALGDESEHLASECGIVNAELAEDADLMGYGKRLKAALDARATAQEVA